jgi:hypothetical protein
VLSNPNIILGQITDTTDQKNLDLLDDEIRQLEQAMNNYQLRRRHLLEAMELGEFEKDEILDRLNNIKHPRHEDEIKLNDLRKTRENITSLANAKIRVNELYERILDNLQNSTPEIKALALDALDIKVIAKSVDDLEIQGVIPLELALPTTGQTWGCSLNWTYIYKIDTKKSNLDTHLVEVNNPDKGLNIISPL